MYETEGVVDGVAVREIRGVVEHVRVGEDVGVVVEEVDGVGVIVSVHVIEYVVVVATVCVCVSLSDLVSVGEYVTDIERVPVLDAVIVGSVVCVLVCVKEELNVGDVVGLNVQDIDDVRCRVGVYEEEYEIVRWCVAVTESEFVYAGVPVAVWDCVDVRVRECDMVNVGTGVHVDVFVEKIDGEIVRLDDGESVEDRVFECVNEGVHVGVLV